MIQFNIHILYLNWHRVYLRLDRGSRDIGLITERLNHFKHGFSRKKKTLDHILRQLEGLLNPTYMTKTHHLNGQKSSLPHRQHIKTHRKKCADLLKESNSPILSLFWQYDSTPLHFSFLLWIPQYHFSPTEDRDHSQDSS